MCISSTSPVRYNKDTEEFEYRCEGCRRKNSRQFWPLTVEFWNPHMNMRYCRACNKERKAKFEREKRRANPEYRIRTVEASKACRQIKGHIYNANRTRTRKRREKEGLGIDK